MTSEDCETCDGTGEIDLTLGGEGFSDPHCPCPDCVASVKRYVPPPPRKCICHWLGFMGFKCAAHRLGK